MKLLMILSTEECTNDMRKILAREDILLYQETDVRGSRLDVKDEATDLSSWLAKADTIVYSKLFFTLQDEPVVENILSVINHYNRMYEENLPNPFCAYQLNIESTQRE